jgi:hypothetical protein
MKVQELAEFLDFVDHDIDTKVYVTYKGQRYSPTLSTTAEGALLIEIRGPRLKRKLAKKITKAFKKTERSKKVLKRMRGGL